MVRYALLAAALFAASVRAEPAKTLKVLFIGNSYVYYNDMPALFAGVARAKGVEVETGMVAPGGSRFADHAKDPETRRALAAKDWDAVVLQEQSQLPALEDAKVEAEVQPAARELVGLISAARPETKVYFYETWGRKDGDEQNCRPIPGVCTYAGMQQRLSKGYAELARRNGARVARVGTAWAKVRASHPELELYDPDGGHPSRAGSYLAACVFYASITGGQSSGATPPRGIAAAQAQILQAAADAAALSNGRRR